MQQGEVPEHLRHTPELNQMLTHTPAMRWKLIQVCTLPSPMSNWDPTGDTKMSMSIVPLYFSHHLKGCLSKKWATNFPELSTAILKLLSKHLFLKKLPHYSEIYEMLRALACPKEKMS